MDKISPFEMKRYAQKRIAETGLNLAGLSVFTEWANGPYLFVPLIAAWAGANKVFAYSPVLSSSDAADCQLAKELIGKKEDQICWVMPRFPRAGEADIVMNSGKVRPIDSYFINRMKPTAVIPMMMMPFEYREKDVDLEACRQKEILYVGTDESSLLLSVGFKILKLLFEAGMAVWNEKFLIITDSQIGGYVVQVFNNLGIDIVWSINGHTSDWDGSYKTIDAVIFADFVNNERYDFGNIAKLVRENPFLKIINVRGNFDYVELKRNGFSIYPDVPPMLGHSPVNGEYLSYKILFELVILSLKAAEVAARCRLSGMGIEETKIAVIKNSPGIF
jgi:hypothetical protein